MGTNPADMKSQLIEYLKELGLPTMRGGFEELAHRAQQESHGYERYLLELAERECQARRGRRTERLLRESGLPLAKTLEALDLKRLPPKVVQQVRGLLDGAFLGRCENVLVFGNPGSGKPRPA
jgi:DNA replication protein DnaC